VGLRATGPVPGPSPLVGDGEDHHLGGADLLVIEEIWESPSAHPAIPGSKYDALIGGGSDPLNNAIDGFLKPLGGPGTSCRVPGAGPAVFRSGQSVEGDGQRGGSATHVSSLSSSQGTPVSLPSAISLRRRSSSFSISSSCGVS